VADAVAGLGDGAEERAIACAHELLASAREGTRLLCAGDTLQKSSFVHEHGTDSFFY